MYNVHVLHNIIYTCTCNTQYNMYYNTYTCTTQYMYYSIICTYYTSFSDWYRERNSHDSNEKIPDSSKHWHSKTNVYMYMYMYIICTCTRLFVPVYVYMYIQERICYMIYDWLHGLCLQKQNNHFYSLFS